MDAQTILALAVLVIAIGVASVLVLQSDRFKKAFFRSSKEGHELSIEMQDLIRQEVNRTREKVLQTMVDIDLNLLDLDELRLPLEKPSIYRAEDELKKLDLCKEKVKFLEAQLSEATDEEKVHFAWILRELYPLWLYQGRKVHASSEPYQKMKKQVEEMLRQFKDTLAASK